MYANSWYESNHTTQHFLGAIQKEGSLLCYNKQCLEVRNIHFLRTDQYTLFKISTRTQISQLIWLFTPEFVTQKRPSILIITGKI